MITEVTHQINNDDKVYTNSNDMSPVGVLRYWLARVDGQVSRLFPNYLSQMQQDASDNTSIEQLETKLTAEARRLGKENTIDITADVQEARQFYQHFLEDLIKAKSLQVATSPQISKEPVDMVSNQVQPPAEDTTLNLDLSASFLSPSITANADSTKIEPPKITTSLKLLSSDVQQTSDELSSDIKEISPNVVLKQLDEESPIKTDTSISNEVPASVTKLVEDTVKQQNEHAEFVNLIKQQGTETVKTDLAAKVSQLYKQRRKEHRELNQISNAMIQETMVNNQ
jgi:hypothetical protein